MFYSIGEVSKLMGITISTIRYYDREGLFPDIQRSVGGIRVFTDTEIGTLRIIECLKISGLSIKNIKRFLDWCKEGDTSLQKRRDLFYERREAVTRQIADMQKIMDVINFKCWYYDTALAAGSEDIVKNTPVAEMPEEIQRCCTNT